MKTPDSKRWASVPAAASEDYWNGWWEQVGVSRDGKTLLLQSLRTGRDADHDGDILVARMASGLYFDVRTYTSKMDAQIELGIAR